jgi:hypothetical protein
MDRIATFARLRNKACRLGPSLRASAQDDHVTADIGSICADVRQVARDVCTISRDGSRTPQSLIATKLPKILPQVEPIASEISKIGPKVPARKAAAEKPGLAGKTPEPHAAAEPAVEAGGKTRTAAKPATAAKGPSWG